MIWNINIFSCILAGVVLLASTGCATPALSTGPKPPDNIKAQCLENAYSESVGGWSYITLMPDGVTVDFLCKYRKIVDWRLVRGGAAIAPRSDNTLVTFDDYASTGWGPGIRSTYKTNKFPEPHCVEAGSVMVCSTANGPYIDELIRGSIEVGYIIYSPNVVKNFQTVRSSDSRLYKTTIEGESPIFTAFAESVARAAVRNHRYTINFKEPNSFDFTGTNLRSENTFECESIYKCHWP